MNANFWGPFAALLEDDHTQVLEVEPYSQEIIDGYDALCPNDDLTDYEGREKGRAESVLELCCGTGRVLEHLVVHGDSVTGVDTSAPALDRARRRLESLTGPERSRAELIQADVLELDLGRTFDRVILPASTVVLFCAPHDRRRLFERAAQHLGADGELVFDLVDLNDADLDDEQADLATVQLGLGDDYATVRMGAASRPDSSLCDVNTHWTIESPEGVQRHLVERKLACKLGVDQIEEEVEAAGLSVLARDRIERAPGQWRTVFRCAHRRALSNPLWHPHLPRLASQQTTVLSHGRGTSLVSDDGRQFTDLASGLWSTQCGLGHPEIVAAVRDQLEELSYGTLFQGYSNKPALELSQQLVERMPCDLPAVYLTNSGSESVELGLKIARRFHALGGQPEKRGILYLDHSYHGTFFGSMSVSGLHLGAEHTGPGLPGVQAIQAPVPPNRLPGESQEEHERRCVDELRACLHSEGALIAALLLEPVLGSAGAIAPSADYFQAVQALCRSHDVLLLVDEVATGFGRTGAWMCSEQVHLRPDVMMLSKGISSGYLPLGAVLFSRRLDHRFEEHGASLGHGSSHNGNPACCAAGLATLAVLESGGLIERARRLGASTQERLREWQAEGWISEVHGRGLMLGLELQDGSEAPANPAQIAAIQAVLKDLGILVYPSISSILLLPALNIENSVLDGALDLIGHVLSTVTLEGGRVHGRS